MGTEFQFCKMKSSGERDGGVGGTTVGKYFMALKTVNMVNSMFCIVYPNK